MTPSSYLDVISTALNVAQTIALAYIAARWGYSRRNGNGSSTGQPSSHS